MDLDLCCSDVLWVDGCLWLNHYWAIPVFVLALALLIHVGLPECRG